MDFLLPCKGERWTNSHLCGLATSTKTLRSPVVCPSQSLLPADVFTLLWDFDVPLNTGNSPQRSACYLSMSNSCSTVAFKLQQQQTFTVFFKSRVRTCQGSPTWIWLFQIPVCGINVRTRQRFMEFPGFVSVFCSAVVTLCVLTGFAVAQVGVNAGFCTVPSGPDEVIDLKKLIKSCASAR